MADVDIRALAPAATETLFVTARKVFVELLALFFIFCAAEAAYRFYKVIRYGIADYPDAMTVGYYETDPTYGIVPKKNFSSEQIPKKLRNEPTLKISFGAHYTTNSRGFRGPEVAVPKPPDVYRVVVIGDSSTFSLELNDDETWPAVLQALLQGDADFLKAHGAQRVEVVNASGGGWRTREELIRLKEEIPPLQPDLVLSAVSWNDAYKGIQGIDPEKARIPQKPWVRRVKIFENLWIRMDNLKSADKSTQEELRKKLVRDSRWAEVCVRNLKEMDQICRTMGSDFRLVDLPGLCRSGISLDSEEFRAITSRTRVNAQIYPLWVDLKTMMSSLFRETEIPVIDVHKAFETFTGPDRVSLFMDEMHTTAPGAREIAGVVHSFLKLEIDKLRAGSRGERRE